MRKAPFLLIGLLLSTGVARAQSVPPAENASDKMIAKGATGAVADWEEEPWWLALADCASAFMLDPEDRDKVKAFSVAAMKRVSTDRAIDLRQAGGVVIPYVTSGQGLERAHTTNALFGPEYLRARCDRVIIQYRAAFP